MELNSFKIFECSCEKEIEINYLSKFKKWVCKIFKIIPEKKYHYAFNLKVPYAYCCVNDIILLQSGEKFIITDIVRPGTDENTIKIQNIDWCDKIKNLYGEFVILGNAFAAGTRDPISR